MSHTSSFPSSPESLPAAGSLDPSRRVGILGMGIIGRRVVDSCRRAGLEVVAWNRTRRGELDTLETPADVARRALVLQIFVTDDRALASVLDGLLPALTADHVVLNCSTVSLEATQAAAASVGATGAAFWMRPLRGVEMRRRRAS